MEYTEVVDESDQEKEFKKLLFSHSFAQEGSRSFRTENELAATRRFTSPTFMNRVANNIYFNLQEVLLNIV